MKNSFLIRLDDACPTMHEKNWLRMEALLDKYNVKPMVGVIPNNEDPKQIIGPEILNYWKIIKLWQEKGWTIALHGYDHCYVSDQGLQGLNPLWRRSEFSGVPYEIQRDKIKKGYQMLKDHGIDVNYFFAPAHTFDENTLKALYSETSIRKISDTIALKPYRKGPFIFIPQYTGGLYKYNIGGVFTRCFHPSTMNEESFERAARFISANISRMISFADLDFNNVKKMGLMDRMFSYIVYKKRKVED